MNKLNVKKRLTIFVLVAAIITCLIPNFSFAYVEDATWGISTPFPSNRTFYNENGSVKTLYTYSNEFNFSIKDNPSNKVYSNLTQVYLSKETKIRSGEFGPWQNANVICWGTVSASSVGGIFFSSPYYKVKLPEEGRYKVLVFTYDQNGSYLYSQQFTVLYSRSMVADYPRKIVNDAYVDTTAFTNTQGNWSRLSFTVHDLTGKGLTLNQIYLRLCNLHWMSSSFGHAACYKPTDVTITKSTINQDEYFVSATISASMFNNEKGEYYIECSLDASWSGMFPALFIK
ncbi:hypothetical protein [Pseudobacteroides cellulosolvens]|uniref:Uncharacterized protein n=1 Tax=Pseudobacteroides cellulosolvens ATCC 35603 = DSM 2933 TaxID=398512 RepID=A0A0L6JHP7_9FIRM|nr:hypothetical protein [Pseudobacteroides cellulosolvens]KNY25376.1 hypothetical protein Bccel_0636 [Pseudobacteroides cellulosolvens ATCC 35603 = DSM 2933]